MPNVKPTTTLDFSALEVSTTEDTKIAVKRNGGESKYANHPLLQPLSDSYKDGKVRAITVNTDQAKDVQTAIRGCAVALKIGHRVDIVPAGKGKVTVRFVGKAKKSYTRKAKDEQGTETPQA